MEKWRKSPEGWVKEFAEKEIEFLDKEIQFQKEEEEELFYA
jgi:hypothetical protein